MNLLRTPDKQIDAFTNAMNVDKTGLFVTVEKEKTSLDVKIFNNANDDIKTFSTNYDNSMVVELPLSILQVEVNNYWIDLPLNIRKQINVTYLLYINFKGGTKYYFKQN